MSENSLEQIYNSAEKFLTPLTLEETYSRIINELSKLSGCFGGVILLYKNRRWYTAYSNVPLPKVKTRKTGFSYQAFKLGKPLIVSFKDVANVHPEYRKISWKRSIFIPLSYSKKKVGVLILLQKTGKKPNQKKLNILKVFSSLATMAIRKTQLTEEIKNALDTRELFISMAAHELRTPLTTINAYIQLLQKKIPNKETISEDWIMQLAKANKRLNKLIHELLQVEQIKKGKLDYNYQETSLEEIIGQAVIDFKFFNPVHKLILINKLGDNNLILGDPDKLLQVFNNVLNNAAKFSEEESQIKLTLENKHLSFIIQVEDQGVGIEKKDLDKIFQKFYKGSQEDREGLGLGLYLTKKIIKKHNGHIVINNGPNNKGTVVKIILPQLKHVRTTSSIPPRATST